MWAGVAFGSVGQALLHGLEWLVYNPLLYISVVLMIWDLQRNAAFERKFFGIRVTKVWRPMLFRWFFGLLVGLVMSFVLMILGAVVEPWEVWSISGVAFVFGLIRIRLFSGVYAIGLLSTVFWITRLWHVQWTSGSAETAWDHVRSFHVLSWLTIAVLLYFAEALFVFLYRAKALVPAAVHSKRGRVVGAFAFQLAMVAPLMVLIPGTHHLTFSFGAQWPTFYNGFSRLTYMGLPLMFGYGGLYATMPTWRATKHIVWQSVGSAIILAIVVYFIYHNHLDSLIPLGVLLAIGWREAVLFWIQWQETHRDARFVPVPSGVRILSTVRGSVAEKMGLKPGEIITEVNQVPVHTAYDLHFAFEQNPAYAKLQVIDERGEPRFVGKPVFDGGHAKLGLILVPDRYTGPSYKLGKSGLLQTIYLRLKREEHTGTLLLDVGEAPVEPS